MSDILTPSEIIDYAIINPAMVVFRLLYGLR